MDLSQLQASLSDHSDHESYYRDFDEGGYQFGANFKAVCAAWRVPGEILAEMVLPTAIENTVDDSSCTQPFWMPAFVFQGHQICR